MKELDSDAEDRHLARLVSKNKLDDSIESQSPRARQKQTKKAEKKPAHDLDSSFDFKEETKEH